MSEPLFDKDSEALLPCPFCGGDAHYDNADEASGGKWYACTNCGAKQGAPYGTPDSELRALWNRRSATAMLAEEAQRLHAPLPECGTINAAPQAASTLAKVDVPESDRGAKVSGEPAVAAPTPRTDAVQNEADNAHYRDGAWRPFSPTEDKGWAFARQLERELDVAKRGEEKWIKEANRLAFESARSTSGRSEAQQIVSYAITLLETNDSPELMIAYLRAADERLNAVSARQERK